MKLFYKKEELGKMDEYDRKNAETQNLIVKIAFGLILIFLLATVFNPIVLVGPGERGIVTNFGQVQPVVWDEGLHFKIPIMQTIFVMDVKTQKVETDATAASKDLQNVHAKIAVNYKPIAGSINVLFQEVGISYADRIIAPAIQESVKASTAKFSAEELITHRELIKADIETALSERLSRFFIELQGVSVTNFDFSSQFNAAIESKVTAEQDALRAQRDLQRIKIEAEQTVARARAESDSKKLQADAEAYQIKAKADSDAYQIQVSGEARAESLRLQRAQISRELIDYQLAQQWDGALPTFTGQSIPFLNVDNLAGN